MMTERHSSPELRPTHETRSALEALFAPKPSPTPAPRSSVRMVLGKATEQDSDPRATERQKRLARLLSAEGHHAVSRTTELFLGAGFSIPFDQEVQLKVLEHSNEERVRDALSTLMAIFEREQPKRRTVLDARLRRLEENADERPTRELAAALRRRVATEAIRGSRTVRD